MDKFDEIYLKLITEATTEDENKNKELTNLKNKLSAPESLNILQEIQKEIVNTSYTDMTNESLSWNGAPGWIWYERLAFTNKFAHDAREICFKVAESAYNGGKNSHLVSTTDWAVVLQPFGKNISPVTPALATFVPETEGFAIYGTSKDYPPELMFTKYTNIEETLSKALEGNDEKAKAILQFYNTLITTGVTKLRAICNEFWYKVNGECYKFYQSNVEAGKLKSDEKKKLENEWYEGLIKKYGDKISSIKKEYLPDGVFERLKGLDK